MQLPEEMDIFDLKDEGLAHNTRDWEWRAQFDYDFPVKNRFLCTFVRADRLNKALVSHYLLRSLKQANVPTEGLGFEAIVADWLVDFSWETSERCYVAEGEFVFITLEILPWLEGETLEERSYCVQCVVREKHGYVYDYCKHGWGKFLCEGMNFNRSQPGAVIGFYPPVLPQEGTRVVPGKGVRFAVVIDNIMLNPHQSIGLYREDGCREYGEVWTPAREKRKVLGEARIQQLNHNIGVQDCVGMLYNAANYRSIDPAKLESLRSWLDQLPAEYSFDSFEMMAIHRESPVENLEIFKVGQLKEEVYWRWVDVYNRLLKKMMYTMVACDGAVFQSRKGFELQGNLLDLEPEDVSYDFVSWCSAYPIYPQCHLVKTK